MTGLVLLTGATGFVGRQILSSLIDSNLHVRVVVRAGSERSLFFGDGLERIVTTADLFREDLSWWREVCDGVDVIIHAAWYAEPGKYLQADINLDCLTGTIELAKGAIEAGVRRFIGIGTCFEYDLSGGLLSVNTPLAPKTLYAASKAAAYLTLSQCFSIKGIEFAWCRLFYLYGEGEDERRLVPYIRKQLQAGKPANLTSGKQIRDFLDVREAGDMICNVALGDQNGPVNICSGVPITVRQLAESIADDFDRRDLLNFGARPDNFVDPRCVIGSRKI